MNVTFKCTEVIRLSCLFLWKTDECLFSLNSIRELRPISRFHRGEDILLSSGLQHPVVWEMVTIFSEEHASSTWYHYHEYHNLNILSYTAVDIRVYRFCILMPVTVI
jgi:hypothetical protein